MTGENFDPRWDGAFIPDNHWHFHRQLWRRYSIVLKPRQFSKIVRSIRRGKARPVETQANGNAVYLVYIGPSRVYVVAHELRLVTVLPHGKPRLRRWERNRSRSGAAASGISQPF